ncbi:MAG: SGNH/GDSL hydrolase family protein, partial [Actinobacteria bacterium]|nr:SGNH/GDSL hydrolase family protein [Actinomycetota bacterium]
MRYVAIGDSFTEGVGDELPDGTVRGWADLVAEGLAGTAEGTPEAAEDTPEAAEGGTHAAEGVIQAGEKVYYANLAIRGRKLPAVLAEQVEPAIALRPDLVSVYAGGNDLMRPKVDLDALVATYAEALGRLRASG